MQALTFRAAEALPGAWCGHLQFGEQHVEVLDHQLAGLGIVFAEAGGCGAHFLQGHIGSRQGAGLLQYVAQAAGVHGQDAGVSCHQGVAHIAEEPAHVAQRLAHPIGAVTAHGNRAEASGQHNPYIGVATCAFEQASDQVAAGVAGALGEGLHRTLEGGLVSGQGGGVAGPTADDAQRSI